MRSEKEIKDLIRNLGDYLLEIKPALKESYDRYSVSNIGIIKIMRENPKSNLESIENVLSEFKIKYNTLTQKFLPLLIKEIVITHLLNMMGWMMDEKALKISFGNDQEALETIIKDLRWMEGDLHKLIEMKDNIKRKKILEILDK